MRKIIFSLLMLISVSVAAQRIERDEVDKFNGSRYVSTNQVPLAKILGTAKLSVSASKSISASEETVSKNIVLTFWFKASTVFSISKKNNCLLKFDNGEVFELPYLGDVKIYTTNDLCYFLTKVNPEQIEIIKANKLTDVRIETSKYSTDIEVKEKFQTKLSETVQVLQDHLNKK